MAYLRPMGDTPVPAKTTDSAVAEILTANKFAIGIGVWLVLQKLGWRGIFARSKK